MRVLYDQKREELRHLMDRGAEAHKLEETQTYIRKLSTRIRIAIQVVNSISKKISQLRDEELWPQTCELVQGLVILYCVFEYPYTCRLCCKLTLLRWKHICAHAIQTVSIALSKSLFCFSQA